MPTASRDDRLKALYFPHDYNAQGDPKTEKLVRTHGWAGYGLFWAIVERIYTQEGRIDNDPEHLAYVLRADPKTVKSVITDFDLFFVDNSKRLGSHSADRRLKEREHRRRMASAAGRASGRTRAERSLNGRSTDVELERKKRKERKERKKNVVLKDHGVDSCESGKERREWSATEDGMRMPWGEWRGCRVMDLDADYCAWLLRNKAPVLRATKGLYEAVKARVAAKDQEGRRG